MGWSPFRRTGLTHHSPGYSVKGYTLFVPLNGDAAYLINMKGEIVKRWRFDAFKPGHARLLENGNLLVSGTDEATTGRIRNAQEEDYQDLNLHFTRLGGGYTSLREYDFAGQMVWSYDSPALHHDFLPLRNGRFLLPLWVPLPDDLARQVRGGIRQRGKPVLPMVGDDIVEIDRQGKEHARVCTWQMFDPRKDPIRPLLRRWEWTHLNSVDADKDGRLVISCRNNSRVALLEAGADSVTWKIGDPDVSLQHHATFVKGGNVQIFDNGMNKTLSLPFSRIIEVDGQTREICWEYKAQPTPQFYSGHISGAQRLARGNVLICEGTSGRLFEITRRGEIVWEWINPTVNGSDSGELSTAIYRAYRYELDHPAIAAASSSLQASAYQSLNEAWNLSAD